MYGIWLFRLKLKTDKFYSNYYFHYNNFSKYELLTCKLFHYGLHQHIRSANYPTKNRIYGY